MKEDTEDIVFRSDPVKSVYVLAIGAVVLCILLSGCCQRTKNNGGIPDLQDIFFDIIIMLTVLVITLVIYCVLPIQITVYDKYVIYKKSLCQEKKVYWHYYNSNNKSMLRINFIPVLWWYNINYIDSGKKKHRLNCGMLSGSDFSKLVDKFTEEKYKIEISRNTQINYEVNSNFVTTKKIEVPKKEIKKRLFLPCKIALLITILIFVTEMIQGWADSDSTKISMDTEGIIFLPIFLLLFFSVPIYMYIRLKIVYPRIPTVVLLQPERIEIDGVQFSFSGITKGVILYGDSVGKRILSFVYEGKKYKYYFGTAKENKEDIFPKYKELSDYLQNKGFEAQIYTFHK